MSSYYLMTKHPKSHKWEKAMWLDDHFGPHRYGVKFPSDGVIYNPEYYALKTK